MRLYFSKALDASPGPLCPAGYSEAVGETGRRLKNLLLPKSCSLTPKHVPAQLSELKLPTAAGSKGGINSDRSVLE